MPRGPKPKPLNELVDPRRNRHSDDLDTALPAEAPEMPEHLDEQEKKVWKHLADKLGNAGVLRETDSNALERYCVTFVAWRKAVAVLKKEGYSIEQTNKSGEPYLTKRPEVSIANELASQLAKLESSFGLTPGDRTRIRINPIEKKVDDDKSNFFSLVG